MRSDIKHKVKGDKLKVKLLKKLRAKFNIVYYPGSGEYVVNLGKFYHFTFTSIDEAIFQRNKSILDYGREHYLEYAKQIIIN